MLRRLILPAIALGLGVALFLLALNDTWTMGQQWLAVGGVCACFVAALLIDRPLPDRATVYHRVKLGLFCCVPLLLLAAIPLYTASDYDPERITDPKLVLAGVVVALAIPIALVVAVLCVPLAKLAFVSSRANSAMLGLLFTLGAAEIYFRATAPEAAKEVGERSNEGVRVGTEAWWEVGPGAPRYWLKADHDFVYTFPSDPRGYFGEDRQVVHEVNAERYRGPVRSIPKPDDVYRVQIVGDSAAFGWGVRYDDMLPAELAGRVGGKQLEVMTLGVPGYTTVDELELFETLGQAYEPDLVVVWYSMNDVATPFEPVSHEEARPEIAWYREWSKTVDACVRTIGRTIHERRYTKDLINQYVENGASWRRVKDALVTLRDRAAAIGAKTILVIEPRMGPLDPETYYFRGPHRVVAEFCKQQDIPCYDLIDTVADLDFRDLVVHPIDHHSNEVAIDHYAERLAEVLPADGVLPTPPDPK